MRIVGRNAMGPGGVAIEVEGDRITSITSIADPGLHAPWVGPGLFDAQVNGYGDGDANADSPTPEQIERMARGLAQCGVTRFLPTIITAPPEAILARIEAIVAAMELPYAGAMVAGIHVEGPALSPEDGPRGVHPLEHLRDLTRSEVGSWLVAAPQLLRVVTLSPHFAQAPAITQYLVSRGVRVAIGHTHADEAQIQAAVAAGASLSTHLGNGAHRELPRHPNYLWSQLAEPRLAAGVIGDGHHLPDSTLAVMLAAKRDHGVFLVSDAVATPKMVKGQGAGSSGQVSSVGGGVELTADGALRHSATGFLAGSVQTLDVGVATAARVTGTLPQAVDLASTAPSAALGFSSPWRPGARADIVEFDWEPGARKLFPRRVYLAGETLSA